MNCERCVDLLAQLEALGKEHGAVLHDLERVMQRETEALNKVIAIEELLAGYRASRSRVLNIKGVIADLAQVLEHESE